MSQLHPDLWWTILCFVPSLEVFLTSVPRTCKEMRRWSRNRKLIVQLWRAQVLNSEGLTIPAETTTSSLVSMLLWFQESSRTAVNCCVRRWDDDNEVEVSAEVIASMQEACYVVPRLSDEVFENVAIRVKTSTTAHQEEERSFLERHTYLTKAQDYLWVSHYTETYSTREQKKARYITIVGPSSASVTVRYYEVNLEGDFPKFFCRLDGCLGLEFEQKQQSMLPILQVGHGRVEVDIRPTVYEKSLNLIRNHLGLTCNFPLGSLWNILVRRIPLEGLGQHARALKALYGLTLSDVMHQILENENVKEE